MGEGFVCEEDSKWIGDLWQMSEGWQRWNWIHYGSRLYNKEGNPVRQSVRTQLETVFSSTWWTIWQMGPWRHNTHRDTKTQRQTQTHSCACLIFGKLRTGTGQGQDRTKWQNRDLARFFRAHWASLLIPMQVLTQTSVCANDTPTCFSGRSFHGRSFLLQQLCHVAVAQCLIVFSFWFPCCVCLKILTIVAAHMRKETQQNDNNHFKSFDMTKQTIAKEIFLKINERISKERIG